VNIKLIFALPIILWSCESKEKPIKNHLISSDVEKIIIDFEKAKQGLGSSSMDQIIS
jgi:hypothetical protein